MAQLASKLRNWGCLDWGMEHSRRPQLWTGAEQHRDRPGTVHRDLKTETTSGRRRSHVVQEVAFRGSLKLCPGKAYKPPRDLSSGRKQRDAGMSCLCLDRLDSPKPAALVADSKWISSLT